MKIEELQNAWRHLRTEQEHLHLSDEQLYDMLPPGRSLTLRQVLRKTTHYAAIYGFLIFCCQTC